MPSTKLTFTVNGDELEKHGEFPKTKLAALRASIRKWETIVAEYNRRKEVGDRRVLYDGACRTCSLCYLYFRKGDGCEGCPVVQTTGKKYCLASPYEEFSMAMKHDDFDNARRFSRDELQFLQRLEKKMRR